MDLEQYNPENITDNTIAELLRQESFPLHPVRVDGGGVYLLYYTGDLALYKDIRSPDASTPIYAGCSCDLSGRLGVHCKTLDSVWNLNREDFLCRVLLLPPAWEKPIEEKVIERFQPWWNDPKFQGFGNNHKRPLKGKACAWDIFHPGRKFALDLERPSEAQAALMAERARRRISEDLVFDMFGDD